MSNFVGSIITDIYNGTLISLPPDIVIKLEDSGELDNYIEESTQKFLKEMVLISQIPIDNLRVSSSILMVEKLVRSLSCMSYESHCFAIYLINVAEQTEWMKSFLSNVAVKTVNNQYLSLSKNNIKFQD